MINTTKSITSQVKDIFQEDNFSDINSEEYYLITAISWQQYESILNKLEDSLQFRVTYLNGVLKILSPSRRHENIKTRIGSLLELYFLEKDIEYYPMGSTTFRKQGKKGGIEPDESYCIGAEKEFPDLAIEVVLTSGGIDSLEVYKRLGIKEVWFWQDEQFFLYHLRDEEYELISRSEILPDLDMELFSQCIQNPHPLQAAQDFRQSL